MGKIPLKKKPKLVTSQEWNAKAAFENGQHNEVVQRVLAPGISAEESMALVASLSFLGRLEEAVDLWSVVKGKLSARERSRCRFAMALGWMRISQFKKAKRFLSKSVEDAETKVLPDVLQGLGVFYYYLGRYPLALKYARRARKRSLQVGDKYIYTFATDLLGHTLVQTGKRSAGLRLLELAIAESGGPESSRGRSLSAERLVYEAEAGLRCASIVAELETAYQRTAETSYTKANLALELARQLTLRGEWGRARTLLDQESRSIYSFENRRQEATLQLRLAELSFRKGEASEALHFLRSAERCLPWIADRVYEIQILGLELKVRRKLLSEEPSPTIVERLRTLSEKHPWPMNHRIQNRLSTKPSKSSETGDDPLGDLLDSLYKEPHSAAARLLETAYLGLWPEFAGLQFGKSYFVLFASRHWIAVDPLGVLKSRGPLSPQACAILRCLSEGLCDKEKLVRQVWHYDYDPLRHDPMVYAALAALRKALGNASKRLETHDQGWRFRELLCMSDSASVNDENQVKSEASTSVPIPEDLNWRQVSALTSFPDERVWRIQEYKRRFKVSSMTAWRDLDELVNKGYLFRIGHGRATAYIQEV